MSVAAHVPVPIVPVVTIELEPATGEYNDPNAVPPKVIASA
jgi:hypothetical protein